MHQPVKSVLSLNSRMALIITYVYRGTTIHVYLHRLCPIHNAATGMYYYF